MRLFLILLINVLLLYFRSKPTLGVTIKAIGMFQGITIMPDVSIRWIHLIIFGVDTDFINIGMHFSA